MQSFVQPFDALDRTFALLTSGPGQPFLDVRDVQALAGSELSAEHVVDLLRHEPDERTDVLWRRVIARIRAGQSAWTVVAAKAMAPLMVTAIWRFGRLHTLGGSSAQSDELDSELMACLIDQLHTLDLDSDQIGRRLWQAMANAACRYRKALQREDRHRAEADVFAVAGAGRGRGPVSVLAEAVSTGLLTGQEADLVSRTRLEHQSLKQVAGQLGLSYITARRRRQKAEEALTRALVKAESLRG